MQVYRGLLQDRGKSNIIVDNSVMSRGRFRGKII